MNKDIFDVGCKWQLYIFVDIQQVVLSVFTQTDSATYNTCNLHGAAMPLSTNLLAYPTYIANLMKDCNQTFYRLFAQFFSMMDYISLNLNFIFSNYKLVVLIKLFWALQVVRM